MRTGDERLDADRVEDDEGLGLRHRETDQHGTFEPSGDDRNAGRTRARSATPEPRARPRSGDAEPAVLSRARARRRRRG